MNELQIVYLKPDELTPYERNARRLGLTELPCIRMDHLTLGDYCAKCGKMTERSNA
jgi:hypothetical protein